MDSMSLHSAGLPGVCLGVRRGWGAVADSAPGQRGQSVCLAWLVLFISTITLD